jgi:hypothetical protein
MPGERNRGDAEVIASSRTELAMTIADSSLIDRRKARATAGVLLAVAVGVVVWGGYGRGWSWTGLTTNTTLWAWLKLLALPLSLATLPLWLQSHRRMTTARRAPLIAAAAGFGLLILLGYALHWGWTGFAGNTLWDWFEVLLLPVVIATVKYWTAERTIEARHWCLVAGLVSGFVTFAVCAYVLPIGWSGFVGNTLWDWVSLLFIPLLMPLLLVPAVTNWISAGITEEGNAADVITYDIWLTPDNKVTVQVVPSSDEGTAPELVVADAYDVVLATPPADALTTTSAS